MATKKRPSRSTGVGRGNGAGSRVTQFQPGEPSRNPEGRPVKEKKPISLDVRAMLIEELGRSVTIKRGDVKERMIQLRAMVELMVRSFQDATVRDRASFLRFLMDDVLATNPNRDIPTTTVAEVVKQLAEEARILEEEGGRAWPRSDGYQL